MNRSNVKKLLRVLFDTVIIDKRNYDTPVLAAKKWYYCDVYIMLFAGKKIELHASTECQLHQDSAFVHSAQIVQFHRSRPLKLLILFKNQSPLGKNTSSKYIRIQRRSVTSKIVCFMLIKQKKHRQRLMCGVWSLEKNIRIIIQRIFEQNVNLRTHMLRLHLVTLMITKGNFSTSH